MGISLLKAEAVSGKDFSTAVAQLPSVYQEKGLYTGRAFPNDPAATSPEEAAAFSKTQVCSQGKVTIPFAQALCRAEMLANNIDFGAYGFNEDGNCIAEWIHNVCFDMLSAQNMTKTANGMPVGEIISVAFDSKTGTFSANVGGKSLDANTFVLAPFIFAFWGLFMENADFKDAFDTFCDVQNKDVTTRQKAICRMAAIANNMFESLTVVAIPSTSNVRNLNETTMKSVRFAPSNSTGKFKKFTSFTASGSVKKFKSNKDFMGAFANPKRVLSDTEKDMVPVLGTDYILPQEVIDCCRIISESRGSVRPMNNVMLRGDPSVGKTAGARAMAAGLGIPYTFITCNAGTEMYSFIGDMMPVDAAEGRKSINEELFADLPTATDISMDPVISYKAITGQQKDDATETDCMTALFKLMLDRCKDACGNGFRYVESPLVRAIRNGWLVEIQEPSLIQRPGVIPGLNGLLDETATIMLPTGEMLRRHPDCVIVSTLNVDLEGCRPLNQSFLDRQHIIMDMQAPTENIIAQRVRGLTGCGQTVNVERMIQAQKQVAEIAKTRGASDGNINSIRALANWVKCVMVCGDYFTAADWTIISGATADKEIQEELRKTVKSFTY